MPKQISENRISRTITRISSKKKHIKQFSAKIM